MNRKLARQKAVADWMFEVSALLMVFPLLDVALDPREKVRWIPWIGFITGLLFLFCGLYLTPEEK